MRSITLKIASGASEDIATVGDYVRIQTAGVPVRIKSGDGQVDATIEQGDALNLKPFERITVSHSSGGEQTITLLIGDGSSSDSAKVGGSVAVTSLPADAVAMAQTSPEIGVASAQILAAKADRKTLMVQNNDAAATVYLNLAGAAAAVAGGVKIPPGGSVLLDVRPPSGAVFAIASAAIAAGAVVVVEG